MVMGACSFNYGEAVETYTGPNIVMGDVDYVRVEKGDPVVRFRSLMAYRYEDKREMELEHFNFEQFDKNSPDGIDARGRGEKASIELDTRNITLEGNVAVEVRSEDMVMETEYLRWEDRKKVLSAGEDMEVVVSRSDGTEFSGVGFTADARNRTYSFSNGVGGKYVHEDDEEHEADAIGETAEFAGSGEFKSIEPGVEEL